MLLSTKTRNQLRIATGTVSAVSLSARRLGAAGHAPRSLSEHVFIILALLSTVFSSDKSYEDNKEKYINLK